MAWKTMDVQEQRVQFVVAAARKEKSLTALCREFEISRPTGYLWLKRYAALGVAGIAEKSRRPQRSPQQTSAEVEQSVVEARKRYPDWGARKLQTILKREQVALPSTTVHRILLRHGLVAEEDRHRAAVKRFERSAPNQLWQMDFKSPRGWQTAVGPLSVLDDHSRYVTVLQAVGSTRAELVREQLETAFFGCGVPEAMLMDHGVPWWNAGAPAGATWLTIWLMRQGIRLHWSGYRHPQTQGKVERFHGELERAWQKRGGEGKQAQAWLDVYRWEHNHVRPHEALGMKTPADVWRKSERPYDPHPAPWEYEPGSKILKLDGRGKMDAYGLRWAISRALQGQRVKLERIGERVLVYYCRTVIRELDLGKHQSIALNSRPSEGGWSRARV
jgi:transposase InsO family protein